MHLIKSVISILLVLGFALPAMAAEWVQLHKDDWGTSYIDVASIVKDQDGLVHYLYRAEFSKPQTSEIHHFNFTSQEIAYVTNCTDGIESFPKQTFFMGSDIVWELASNPSDFHAPTGRALDTLNYACDKAGYSSDASEKARSDTTQAANDGRPNGAKSHPSRDSTSNKLTALWTTFWAIGLSALLAYFLTKRFSFASPNTAHEQGMKWAAWLTMAIIIIRLSKYFITFDIEHLGMLVASLIFLIPIGYVAGFAYFKFRNRNKRFDLAEDNSVQEHVEEATPAPIKTPAENKITSIEKKDEAIDLARYKQAADETASGNRDDALWYKAFAEYGGDENATKAAYIRLRVEQLRRRAVHEDNMNKLWPTAATELPQLTKPNPKVAKTLYDLLGVSREASKEQIIAGYQLQKWELEAQENKDTETNKKLTIIEHAKKVLLDPTRRAAYDARI